MDSSAFRWLLPAVCALTALGTTAWAADPLDATAPVPPLVHRSTFDSYRNLADPAPLGWREANDTVGRIGGWRAYAREAAAAQADETPASSVVPVPGQSAPAPAAAPARPAGHGGHSMH